MWPTFSPGVLMHSNNRTAFSYDQILGKKLCGRDSQKLQYRHRHADRLLFIPPPRIELQIPETALEYALGYPLI